MGIWAEIKHAINSTLGTEDFKSLDKIIRSMRSLQASDDVYMNLIPLSISSVSYGKTQTFTSSQSLTAYSSGSLKLKYDYTVPTTGDSGRSNKLNILINNEVVSTYNLSTSATSSNLTQTTDEIFYNMGDKISFNVEVTGGNNSTFTTSCSGVQILGTLTEYNAFCIENSQ